VDNLVTISAVRCVKCENKGVYLRGEKFKINDMEFKTIVTGIKAAISKALDFIKENSFVLVILAIFILFHPFFEKAASTLIVDTFLCQLQESLLSDVILFLLSLVVIIRCILLVRKNYYLSSKSVLLSLISLFVIAYYRVSNVTWDFHPTYLFESIKYVDIVILYFISNLVISFCYRKKEYSCIPFDGFSFDDPIENLASDILNRKSFAENFAKKIVNTANTKSSFAIGITSEWGNGKTSFLNLIKSYLPNENRVIIQFNPWLNNDEKSVIMSFFDELSNKLRKYNKELSIDILKYAEILSSIDNNGFTVANKISEKIFNQKNDLMSQFIRINDAIKSAGIQIVIFVDDLDRLYEKEVIEVLRLIRNSANFSNTVFVVAYDRSYVITAIKKANEHKPNRFLEKIFQLEFTLPIYENHLMINYLRNQINPYLTEKDKIEFENLLELKHSITERNTFRYDLIRNIRDVNRLVNSFLISYESLKGEIVLLDLLNLELLRTKYLGVYDLISNDYSSFISTSIAKNEDYNDVHYLTLSKLKTTDGKDTEQSYLANYLDKHHTEVGILKTDIKDALTYVSAVFPFFDDYSRITTSYVSIKSPISIDRYFFNKLLNTNLSEIEFSNYRNSSDGEFQDKIKEWVDAGLEKDVSIRLERIRFYLNKTDYERIIKAIFFYASIPDKDNSFRFLSFDTTKLKNKLNYIAVKSLYTNKDEFQNFVVDLFQKQTRPFMYVSNFMNKIIEDTSINNWDFVLEKRFILNKKLSYFKEYAEKAEVFDRYVFRLFYLSRYKNWTEIQSNGTYRSTEVLQEEATEIYKKTAERLIDSFIMNVITKTDDSHREDEDFYSIQNSALLVWGTWDDFYEFLDKFDSEKVNGLTEFKLFYEKCKSNEFRYVKFNFEEIDLTDAVLFSS